MAECYRCGSSRHLIEDCDYVPPTGKHDRPHGYSLNTDGTYLADIEDAEGHPMALRVKLQSRVTARPPCPHVHSRMCHEGGHLAVGESAQGDPPGATGGVSEGQGSLIT